MAGDVLIDSFDWFDWFDKLTTGKLTTKRSGQVWIIDD